MKILNDQIISEFRDGIFALRTRRFGTVAEIMIAKMFNLLESNSLAFDKKNLENQRIEVKFSTVMKENEDTIRESNIIDQCMKANLANRAMKSTEINKYRFDCNIQQVKRKEFDILYYGLFFADKIEIFKMNTSDVFDCPGYSDKQHRGNEGEGQFHLNQDNLDYHRAHYYVASLTYEELYNLLRNSD